MLINSWINFSQLNALGIGWDIASYVIVSFGIVISYLMVKPFISWFVTFQSTKLLSYIISSLMVIVLFFIVILFVGDLQLLVIKLLEIVLQCLAVFGIALILYYSFQRFIRKT